ncbi:MAG: hypothetical protein F9K24_20345 [Leptonema illini]|uniref:Uncharacterized protein n=1 Tax=Leptonema illini TaxID=183 RepID=A0A833GXK1_9LEPT|nr:MAG: hypothetical protein F9K24_20345 [Leptonema illini]
MSNDIKRMRYFNGLILKEDEFKQDQEYHISMRRMHNLHLHGSGIVRGLELGLTTQNHLIDVSEGIAMDPLGREVVLPAGDQVDISDCNGGDLVYIWVAYSEQDTDVIPDIGGDDFVHIKESAAVFHGKAKPSSDDYVLIGFVEIFTDTDGKPVLYEQSFRELDTLGRPVRVIAGENKESVITRTLFFSDSQINEANRPFLDGRLFEDGSTGKAGIDVVSEHSRFSGDLEISGSLAFSGGPSVTELVNDISSASGDGSASLATVHSIQQYVAGFSDGADSRIGAIEDALNVDPIQDSIAVRDSAGHLKAAPATANDDVLILDQMVNRGYLGDIGLVNHLSDSPDNARETGHYFCPDFLSDLPVDNSGNSLAGIVSVWRENDASVRQLFVSMNSGLLFTRFFSLGLWSPWEPVITQMLGDQRYLKLDDSQSLRENLDVGFHRLTHLGIPIDPEDAARLQEVDSARSYAANLLAMHNQSADHDGSYLALRFYQGDLDQLTVRGAAIIVEHVANTNLPEDAVEGIVYSNSHTAQVDTDIVLRSSQLFISFRDERIWLRTGAVSQPVPAEGDPAPELIPLWSQWIKLATAGEISAHKDSTDHDAHYYNLAGTTPLAGNLNAASNRLINLGAGIDAGDAVIKSQLDQVEQAAASSVTLLASSMNTALQAHRESTDHDSKYVAARSFTGDLNALTTTGVISVLSGSVNLPANAVHGILVNSKLEDGAESLSQLFIDTEHNMLWIRTREGLAAWTSWESPSIHPGIEKDFSNPATGCWMRHPDGTLDQYGTVQLTLGSLAEYPVSIPFPQAFTQIGQLIVSSTDGLRTYSCNGYNDHFEITQGMELTTGFPATVEISLQWRAIGA